MISLTNRRGGVGEPLFSKKRETLSAVDSLCSIGTRGMRECSDSNMPVVNHVNSLAALEITAIALFIHKALISC